MQEANPIETRNVANNTGFGGQLLGFLNNALSTGATVYQAKLQSDAIKNQSTGVNGTVADPRAAAAAAWSAAPWALPVIIGVVVLALVALIRRR